MDTMDPTAADTSTATWVTGRTSRHTAVPTVGLVWRPEDITWTLQEEGLDVTIDLFNAGREATRPDLMYIQVADFGAFLPPRPAAQVPVPPVAPGGRTAVMARVPLTPEEREHGMPTVHWAGNLDVYLASRPRGHVEVHRAEGLEMKANGSSLFMAIPRDVDTYRVDVGPIEDGWEARLAQEDELEWMGLNPWARSGRRRRGPVEGESGEDWRAGYCSFVIEAPGAGEKAHLEVTFTTGDRSVPVHFSFVSTENPRPICGRRMTARQAAAPGIRVMPA